MNEMTSLRELGETLDHDLSAGGRPRGGVTNFTPHSTNAPSSALANVETGATSTGRVPMRRKI